MVVAIMQPYFMPYIGYFQLIHAADHFVYLDDVNFIKKGWINRNYLLGDKQKELFSIPLKKVSQNKLISQTEVNTDDWQKKLLTKIHHLYSKAPQYQQVAPLLESILRSDAVTIADLAIASVEKTLSFLGLPKETSKSSDLELAEELRGSDRILAICAKQGADRYINSVGGMDLYDAGNFSREGIELQFLSSNMPGYKQFSDDFEPGLSMIDVLMFNSPQAVVAMLEDCSFISPEGQA